MDLTGIENEAEFFPAGTLSDVLEVELQDITGRWSRELKGANPVTRLSGSADTYLRLYRQLLNTTDKNLRNELYSQSVALVSTALGYDVKRSSETLALDAGSLVRVMNKTFDADGKQALWIIETPVPAAGEEQADPLGQTFDREQYDSNEQEHAELEKTIEELLAEGIFSLPDAPRYVLVVGASQWVLVDQRKWPTRSVLRFDLQEIFSRQDRDTFRVMACLVAREARVPATGIPIADRLEEEAQRNANAVTTSLKRTVRDAIEILGQEVLDVTGGKFPTGPKRGVWIDGPTLSLECLRYMYRLLFLLYAESNPRLRILDLKDPLYASGYSMEALRDLESVRLRTPQEKIGSYLWDSLQQVLTLLYSGENHVLKLPAVKVSLLDPESTPLLNSVSLRNEAVQKIIRQLSLRSSKKNTGRISYSKLGIGQLGAVYETLISFTGTVAKEDLIELKGDTKDRAAIETNGAGAADENAYQANDAEMDAVDEELESRVDKVDLLAPTYFVPRRRIAEFNPEAVVFEGTQAKIYPKGAFTYRLSGRDREKTAAFYTPEPLARLLVKHLLMERCKDLAADEILELKILEPAMGSAAFLVETTNQLTDLYLERKQVEVGHVIPQEEILLEKQKVRSYIADRNCFGVDLNPTAVELGAISLWLNGLHKGEFSPWFGDQLHAGNSLIGARRAVYPASQLRGPTADLWFKNPPKEIGWKEERPDNTVYQWLLPAGDMAAFEKDKTIKEFAGDHQARIKAWRAGGFFKPLESHEINLVQRLTKVADDLFEIVAAEIARTRDAGNDEITLWPDTTMSGAKGVSHQKKEILKQRLLGEDHAQNTLPFKRLKTAMDAWCALWLWPIEHADKLPSRQEFLEGMRILLEGGFSVDGSLSAGAEDDFAVVMGDLFDQQVAEPAAKYNVGLFQETNVEAFIGEYDWLQVATEVTSEARFVHYDLIFADILKARGGFDLIVGNPPWARQVIGESDMIVDLDPKYFGIDASDARSTLPKILSTNKAFKEEYLRDYVRTKGVAKFSSSPFLRPYTGYVQNIYRLFIDLSFTLISSQGTVGLIHQDGHLIDPQGGEFRSVWYSRIVKHFEFLNRIPDKLFSGIGPEKRFSVNIYRGAEKEIINFDTMSTAFTVQQVEETIKLDPNATHPIPARKNDSGHWSTATHPSRLIKIDEDRLKLIASVTDGDPKNWRTCKFLKVFSSTQLSVIEKFSHLIGLNETIKNWEADSFWSEVSATRDLGYIKKITTSPSTHKDIILTGPMIYVGDSLSKTSINGKSNRDYATIELNIVDPDSYIPRTNFKYLVSESVYQKKLTKVSWASKYHSDFYRLACRNMVALDSERSLVSALIPPKVGHISTITSFAFQDVKHLLNASAMFFSLPYDFLVKTYGLSHIIKSVVSGMPWVVVSDTCLTYVLALSNINENYRNLADVSNEYFRPIQTCFSHQSYNEEVDKFNESVGVNGFRSYLSRRNALVCIDVLVAKALGMTLEELCSIYRQTFSTMQDNEKSTYYDATGKIAWSNYVGLPGVGYLHDGKKPTAKNWLQILQFDDPLACEKEIPGLGTINVTYTRPFITCNRIEDYKRAWAHFEKLEQEGSL